MLASYQVSPSTLPPFPSRDVIKAWKAAFLVLYDPKIDSSDMIQSIIKPSNISRRQGLITLGKIRTTHPILKKGCNLIADGPEEDINRKALRIEIECKRELRQSRRHD